MTSKYFTPETRHRRLRKTAALRDLVRETHLTPNDLILPLFVDEDITEKQAGEKLEWIQEKNAKKDGSS